MTRPLQLSVLVVEAQPVMREGLRINIDAEPDLTVVAEAWDREGALREASSHGPDVVLLDLSLVEIHGERLVRHLLEQSRDSRVIVLSSLEEERLIEAALMAGASMHLRKDAFREQLIAAIRAVWQGRSLDREKRRTGTSDAEGDSAVSASSRGRSADPAAPVEAPERTDTAAAGAAVPPPATAAPAERRSPPDTHAAPLSEHEMVILQLNREGNE